jgi:hypothetical protein
MSIKINQIIEGWRNKIIPPKDLRETIEQVSKERLSICDTCVFHSKNHSTPLRPDVHCTNCGCNLDAKSRCLSCSCPKNKWTVFLNNLEEEQSFKQEAYEQK